MFGTDVYETQSLQGNAYICDIFMFHGILTHSIIV